MCSLSITNQIIKIYQVGYQPGSHIDEVTYHYIPASKNNQIVIYLWDFLWMMKWPITIWIKEKILMTLGEPMTFFFKGIPLFLLFLKFIYFWLCWVFVSVQRLSLVAASGGHPSSRCAGLSLSQPLPLRSTGSRRAGSVIVAHGPSCSAACGIFPDQGSNPCPLYWQADSQPLHHQGSLAMTFYVYQRHDPWKKDLINCQQPWSRVLFPCSK